MHANMRIREEEGWRGGGFSGKGGGELLGGGQGSAFSARKCRGNSTEHVFSNVETTKKPQAKQRQTHTHTRTHTAYDISVSSCTVLNVRTWEIICSGILVPLYFNLPIIYKHCKNNLKGVCKTQLCSYKDIKEHF